MSVWLLDRVVLEGEDPRELLARRFGPAHGLARVTAQEIRDCGQGIQIDERPDDVWHAVVFSITSAKRTKGGMSCLKSKSTWFQPPLIR
jgi:hypothetical protein